jgi:endoglycosylceramidase
MTVRGRPSSWPVPATGGGRALRGPGAFGGARALLGALVTGLVLLGPVPNGALAGAPHGRCTLGSSARKPSCGPVGPISADGGPFLTDATGRVVILHGVDAVEKLPPYELYVDPGKPWDFSAADARAIASLGFTVVRLGILWQGIEPGKLGPNSPRVCAPGLPGDPHQWDGSVARAYLSHVVETVDLLGRYGVFSLLDMHQDVYNQVFAGEGAPAWAVCTDGLPPTNTGNWSANYAEPAVGVAYDHFFDNDVVGNLQGNYDRAWRLVAETFAHNPFVLGYDLFNEPFSTEVLTGAGAAEFDARLECFYTGRRHPGELAGSPTPLVCPPTDPASGLIPTIRAVDRSHPIFYEPDVSSSSGNADWIGPMPYRHLVLDFHDYCLAASFDPALRSSTPVCPTAEDQAVSAQATARAKAADAENPGGPAWFLSEFGAEHADPDLAHMVALADAHLLGFAYWQWKLYGDPTGGPNEPLATTGKDGKPVVDPARAAILSEPYAEAIAGIPLLVRYDPTDDAFSLLYEPDHRLVAPTVVFVPASLHYPHGYCASASGARIASAPGASHLTLSADPHAASVELRILPGQCSARSAA